MMRGERGTAIAVRDADGEIQIETYRTVPVSEKSVWYRIPVIRGVFNFVSMLYVGTKTLLRSSEVYGAEIEPSKFEKKLSSKFNVDVMKIAITFSVILGVALAVGLFVFLPQVIATLIFRIPVLSTANGVFFCLIEGVLRLLIFVGYIVACAFIPDVKRVFMYHGAEHKTINAFEHGEELVPEKIKKYSRIHSRCGTTFLFLVMVIGILVLALAGWLTKDVFGWPDNFGIKLAVRLVLLPLVAGVSYEILKLLARSDNVLVRAIRWPGLQLQRITTKEPDDSMLEVAAAAFGAAYEMELDETVPERKFDIKKSMEAVRKEVREILPEGSFDDSDIDWIFAEATGKSRAEAKTLKLIGGEEEKKALAFAEERKTGRPLQYVFGYTEFYGRRIFVGEGVLVPRPETELLAERAVKISAGKKVLDLCCGSGAVGIAVKAETDAEVWASDVSEEALAYARRNADENGTEIRFVKSDLFSDLDGTFDVIVSNPPYIPTDDIGKTDTEVRDHEPRLALDGGPDGLDFYRRIIPEALSRLNPGGVLLLEAGIGEAEAVRELLEGAGFKEMEIIKDLSGTDRIISAAV